MIVPTDKFACRKNLSTFSATSIAIAIGISKVSTKATELKNFFNMYLSRILKFIDGI